MDVSIGGFFAWTDALAHGSGALQSRIAFCLCVGLPSVAIGAGVAWRARIKYTGPPIPPGDHLKSLRDELRRFRSLAARRDEIDERLKLTKDDPPSG